MVHPVVQIPVMPSEGAPQVRDDHIAHKVRVGLLASLQGWVIHVNW